MISVIITNYNQGRFIGDAIASLTKQSLMPDEVVIIDDKSTDNSIELINKILDSRDWPFQRIELIQHQENQGAAASRNTGIKETDGDIICLLDADDWYYKDKIQKSIEIFNRHWPVGVVYSDYDVKDEQPNAPVLMRREFKFSYNIELLKRNCILSSNSLVRREAFEKSGLYNTKLRGAEDFDIWTRIMKNFLFYHIPEALFCYRLHGENITIQKRDQVIENTQRILNGIS